MYVSYFADKGVGILIDLNATVEPSRAHLGPSCSAVTPQQFFNFNVGQRVFLAVALSVLGVIASKGRHDFVAMTVSSKLQSLLGEIAKFRFELGAPIGFLSGLLLFATGDAPQLQ